MLKKYLAYCIFLFASPCFSLALVDTAEMNTIDTSGRNQIVVSPMELVLKVGESTYADALVLDENGNPIEGKEMQIILQDKKVISISNNKFITNESGYIKFLIIGKLQGYANVIITDGAISAKIHIAILNLIG